MEIMRTKIATIPDAIRMERKLEILHLKLCRVSEGLLADVLKQAEGLEREIAEIDGMLSAFYLDLQTPSSK